MPGKPLRIAILECDTPPADVVAKYGRYDRIFTTLLETAAEQLGLSPKQDLVLSAFDVVTKMEYPDLENVDGVLISGSSMCWIFLGVVLMSWGELLNSCC